MESNILEVNHLRTSFDTDRGHLVAVDDVSFSVKAGETVCLVGESGCGKSVTSLSIMRLLASNGHCEGEINFNNENLLDLSEQRMRDLRGDAMSMVFQEPMTSLNPVLTIGDQLEEGLRRHLGISEKEASERALTMLERVRVPRARQMLKEYPHQLSGGMRQRVMIAMALECHPKLLIADEPTTALDVTIQAQILALVKDIQQEFDTGMILITHDLGVVAEMADRVIMMYAGRVVEDANVYELFDHPKHPYTLGLMKSIPKLEDSASTQLESIPGSVPSLSNMPERGCRFADRCPFAMDICRAQDPALLPLDDQPAHKVSCFLFEDSHSPASNQAEKVSA